LRYQYGDDRGVYVPSTNDADWTIEVDDSVPDERPYVTGAVVREVDLDEDALDSLIQLQEKLHATMGRKRAKGAIGIHDLTMLKGESQTDEAATLLEDAGFEKVDGTWERDGEALELPIKGPSGFSDWVTGVETIVSDLQDFGIEAESVMLDNSTYWGSDYPDGNFVVGLQGWASYDQSYPYFHFDWIFNSWDAENAWSVPGEFEAPVLHDEERDGETVTPTDLVSELSTATE
jgi:hypothetical protein